MSANSSLIDTMARALWLEDARRWLKGERDLGRIPADGKDIDPSQYNELADMPLTGPGFRRQWEGQVRAALQAALKAGPTQAMRKAWHESRGWCSVDQPTVDVVLGDVLRAALEEADNHG